LQSVPFDCPNFIVHSMAPFSMLFRASAIGVTAAFAADSDDAMSLLQMGAAKHKQEAPCGVVPTACPEEGQVKTDDCPEGCKHIESCDMCEKAAKFWKRKYLGANNWPNPPRPTGCFRNRKFKIKCNDQGPYGGFRGKWPVCEQVCGHPKWVGTKYEDTCKKACPTTTTTTTTTTTCKRCSEFACPATYSLRGDAGETCYLDRETCCIKDGACTGQPEGSKCALGDIQKSLIRNPSFEGRSCCPSTVSQLTCANNWAQATSATSDFWVQKPSCPTWYSRLNYVPPFPDGDGAVAAIKAAGNVWHEYIGACLTGPMEQNLTYTFNLQIAAGLIENVYGGDTDGESELMCLPTCTPGMFPISGRGWMGGNYPILAKGKPANMVKMRAGWQPLTFEFQAPAGGCQGIMFGPSKDSSIQSGMRGTYTFYDFMNVQEGSSGTCDKAEVCVKR